MRFDLKIEIYVRPKEELMLLYKSFAPSDILHMACLLP